MVKIINGKAIAEKIKDGITRSIYKLGGQHPNLAIILVGDRPDSQLYVSLKEREGKKVGVDTNLYAIDALAGEQEILDTINFLNSDELIDGILVQLPLPAGFDTDKIIAAIDPKKDVDGFHPSHPDYIVSPVLASVAACLDNIKFTGQDKTACILNNSDVFGDSVRQMLIERGCEIIDRDNSSRADLLISALGEPRSIKKDMIKEGAVIIDIGITKEDGKVYGDADFEDLKNKAGYITPVPGGIGPMTIAFLFQNVWEIYRRRH